MPKYVGIMLDDTIHARLEKMAKLEYFGKDVDEVALYAIQAFIHAGNLSLQNMMTQCMANDIYFKTEGQHVLKEKMEIPQPVPVTPVIQPEGDLPKANEKATTERQDSDIPF